MAKLSQIKIGSTTYDIGAKWENITGKPDYLPLSGGTLTGDLKVNGHVFGYNYGKDGNNCASFIWDKPGSNYTGVGACGEADTIYFGACSDQGVWATDYRQKWKFNGSLIVGGIVSSGSLYLNTPHKHPVIQLTGSGNMCYEIIPDTEGTVNHFRYYDMSTQNYEDYYLSCSSYPITETRGYDILTGRNYSSYTLPIHGGVMQGNIVMGGSSSGLYDNYNGNNYEMIASYKNGNTVLGASGGGLYIGYQNTTYLNIGNFGNWAYWDASVLKLNQEIQSTNVHPLRSVYGNYGLIQRNDGDRYWFLPTAYGDPWGSWAITSVSISLGTGALYGAVWNDYAEFRGQVEEIEPGYCVASFNNGQVYKTTEKLQACDGIVSDTFGFAIGETEECKTPLAVAGRVLAYCNGNRYDYHAGDTVCAGPGGLVYKMTREEIKEYPDRIIGIVSEIPEYENWGNKAIKVNNRIWIKVK